MQPTSQSYFYRPKETSPQLVSNLIGYINEKKKAILIFFSRLATMAPL